MKSSDLAQSDMWWRGPHFLRQLELKRTSTKKCMNQLYSVDAKMSSFISVYEAKTTELRLYPDRYSS